MFLDFLEIGTSDFNALIQRADDSDNGISVDAVKYYLDRLPNLSGCKKLNLGISDSAGTISVHYLHPDKIKTYSLPNWIRGCNSIGSPHPTVSRLLNERGIDLSEVSVDTVTTVTLKSLIESENVSGIYTLKVDTEGHDTVILKKFFSEADPCYYPHNLIFETNSISDRDEVHDLIVNLIKLGYEIVKCEIGGGSTDTHMQLNIHKIKSRSRFSSEIKRYYLAGYPPGYNPLDPPHENTLEAAMEHCKKLMKGGVTYQYGRYEVRDGKYLKREKANLNLKSWILLEQD